MDIVRLKYYLLFRPALVLCSALPVACVTGVIWGWKAALLVMLLAGALVTIARLLRGGESRTDELKRQWGKENTRDRDFDALEEQYLATEASTAGPDRVDAPTWADLDMDSVYACVDRTLTEPGAMRLYAMLRQVRNAPEELDARNRAVRAMSDDEALRMEVLQRLERLGRDRQADLAGVLWSDTVHGLGHTRFYDFLALAAVASILASAFAGPTVLLLLTLPLFGVNGILSAVLVRERVLSILRTLRYLGKTIEAAKALGQTAHPDLKPWTTRVERNAKSLSGISRQIRLLNPEMAFAAEFTQQILYILFTLLLVEVRTFNRVLREVRQHREELQEVVRAVGELDALQSVASFRSALPYCCEPEFREGPAFLRIEDGWHPLTSEPVPNSISCENESLFITGSNMAGKSTFLRMVAVNVILAQTFNVCCARAYAATPFRLASSMAHRDDITGATSYFLAEGRRLLELLRNAESERTPYLCIVDEILRGTNSAERHAASLAVLRHLAEAGATVIAASHDTDLGVLLKDRYRVYHFSETFERDDLVFDYRLKPGICAAGNAIRTLGWLGFSDALVKDARRYLDDSQGSPAP